MANLLLSAALAGSFVAGTVGSGLVLDALDASLLCLRLEDVLLEDALVLEDVTLDLHVELVVQVLVDLLLGAVLDEQATEDAGAADPEDLLGHAGVRGTVALTSTSVAALALSGKVGASAGARVVLGGLADDEAVLHELAHVLAWKQEN